MYSYCVRECSHLDNNTHINSANGFFAVFNQG